MAYTDDWESLMNGVFGAGGRVKFGSGAAQPDTKAKTGGLPDLNAALLEQQKQLDELLKKQNAQLKKQDADTQTALENSRQMLRDMENDGLLAKGTADTKPEHLGSFEGLATEVKKTVLGQDAFVDGVAALCAGHRGPCRPQRDPAERCAWHRAALCAGGDGPHHGGPRPATER